MCNQVCDMNFRWYCKKGVVHQHAVVRHAVWGGLMHAHPLWLCYASVHGCMFAKRVSQPAAAMGLSRNVVVGVLFILGAGLWQRGSSHTVSV